MPLIDTTDEAQVPQGGGQAAAGRAKINPLADWTWGDVWHYIQANKVDYNPLHDQFYPSIGCAPCTRAISLGEDFRAGRWWWEDEAAKECGLHVKDEATVRVDTSVRAEPHSVRAEPVEALRQAQGERMGTQGERVAVEGNIA